ncbi:MAG: prolyl oligopeptidase family serine peptidase [Phycisphaerales bacterium JB052]
MNKARTFVIAILASAVFLLPGCASSGSRSGAELVTPLRIYDLSFDLNAQHYACKVLINEAATKGGAALLFLHGAGECGTDGLRQLHVGLPRNAMQDPEMWPFVIIAPQKPTVNSEWEDHDLAVMHMLDQAAKLGLFDPERLAITGLSQGGHGTITIAGLHPDRFSAAAPVCGYVRTVFDADRNRIPRTPTTADTPEVVQAANTLNGMPTWIHHGGADSVVPVSESRSLSEALQNLGADTRYSEYPGVNHNSWDNAYTDQALSDWFAELLNAE